MKRDALTTWPARNLLLVALYIPTALAGISLAIPPGNVTPVYPAAGLAFGAYLWWGRGILPGIFVGALLGNLLGMLEHDNHPLALSAALAIGVGEVLAVIGAGAVLRRLLGGPPSLVTPAHVLWLFAIALLWVISPTIGVGVLVFHGLVPGSELEYAWITWWLGDAVGVMLVTPLIVLARDRLACAEPAPSGLLPAATTYALVVILLTLTDWPIAFVLIPATMLLVLRYHIKGAVLAGLLSSTLIIGLVLWGNPLYQDYPLNERLLLVQLLLGVNVFTAYFLAAHVHTIARLHSGIHQAREESERDPLTGLLNRRGLERSACQVLRQARQDDQGAALLVLDIDDFKLINDNHGHDFGDRVLKALGDALQQVLRTSDQAARVGGDEFVLLLDASDRSALDAVCRRLFAMTHTLVPAGAPPGFRLTVSGGVAMAREEDGLDTLIARADRRLYLAKQGGKDQLAWSD